VGVYTLRLIVTISGEEKVTCMWERKQSSQVFIGRYMRSNSHSNYSTCPGVKDDWPLTW
jgi:hypothetical protein